MERFLGLTEEEIKRNEQLWGEENSDKTNMDVTGSDLRNIGISSGDFESDLETADELEGQEAPEEGPEVAGPVDSAGGEAVPGGAAGPVGGGGMQI